jgi:hypothetical protein
MFKALFKTNTVADEMDAELEATMRNIHEANSLRNSRQHTKLLSLGRSEADGAGSCGGWLHSF